MAIFLGTISVTTTSKYVNSTTPKVAPNTPLVFTPNQGVILNTSVNNSSIVP